jgi:hypothetical protein
MRNKYIRCKCGKSILVGKEDGSGKRHGHCDNCQLEWHITSYGECYSHKFGKINKLRVTQSKLQKIKHWLNRYETKNVWSAEDVIIEIKRIMITKPEDK